MRYEPSLRSWDSKESLSTCDFHPSGRFATGGLDGTVRIWRLEFGSMPEAPFVVPKFCFSIRIGDQPINCVRFSPNCSEPTLAVADETGGVSFFVYSRDSTVRLSHLLLSSDPDDRDEASVLRGEQRCADNVEATEVWVHAGAHRAHRDSVGVYDLAWAPDGMSVASCSMDNTVVLAAAPTARRAATVPVLADARVGSYACGAAWHPSGKFLVVESADRVLHLFEVTGSGRTTKLEPRRLVERVPAHAALPAKAVAALGATAGARARSKVEGPQPILLDLDAEEADAEASAQAAAEAEAAAAVAERSRLSAIFAAHATGLTYLPVRRAAWTADGAFIIAPAGCTRWPATPDGRPADALGRLGPAAQRKADELTVMPGEARPEPDAAGQARVAAAAAAEPVYCANVFCGVAAAQHERSPRLQLLATLPFPDLPTVTRAWPAGPAPAGGAGRLAVASRSRIVVYEAETLRLLAVARPNHAASVSDLAWSADGLTLAVTSYDGFVSFMRFSPEELG